jgi:hypothetical protein
MQTEVKCCHLFNELDIKNSYAGYVLRDITEYYPKGVVFSGDIQRQLHPQDVETVLKKIVF